MVQAFTSFNGLAPRPYKMEVVKEGGFKKKALDDITIIADQTNALNVELDIGQATETVNVTDAAPLIDTATANFSGTVTADRYPEAPLLWARCVSTPAIGSRCVWGWVAERGRRNEKSSWQCHHRWHEQHGWHFQDREWSDR